MIHEGSDSIRNEQICTERRFLYFQTFVTLIVYICNSNDGTAHTPNYRFTVRHLNLKPRKPNLTVFKEICLLKINSI